MSTVYQFSSHGAQDTRLGNRAQAAIGLTWRLIGSQIEYHGLSRGDSESGRTMLDGVIELNGEWEGHQNENGLVDFSTGGKALYLSPGLRLSSGSWSFALGGSVPLAQDIALSHSETRFRLRLAISRTL